MNRTGPSTTPTYPFTALVGADELTTALLLSAISPEIGGVLVRGEKGTAKSTAVRALAAVLPEQSAAEGCRFGCDPERHEACPDGPHPGPAAVRPARLVELPVGATEDRVVGSLDLRRALGEGEAAYQPGLLAEAHRGILYVDEVNLLHDHLVDVLLDAAAMGRNTVERDGVSISHPARITLVGTMNPEEGELRPQLLDRFGLTVHVAASRDPRERAEVVRRRLDSDADPVGFAARFAASEAELTERLAAAREAVRHVVLDERTLQTIARVCAGFDVDGMRADIVTARTASAHAAWSGRDHVVREDIRAAALLSLPHRRRRAPFDAPGLDEDLLDRLLDEEPEDDPPGSGSDSDDGDDQGADPGPDEAGPEGGVDGGVDGGPSAGSGPGAPGAPDAPGPERGETPEEPAQVEADQPDSPDPGDSSPPGTTPTPLGTASAATPYRARRLELTGVGSGPSGRRSPALTPRGRTVGVHPAGREPAGAPVHLTATLRAAAARRVTGSGPIRVTGPDLRHAVTRGREANLVLLAVDASGSMAARKRMSEVKTAVLSLLLDAYQRRDRVGLVTFRGTSAELALPPTSSVDAAAARLADLPHGGRTPLAEGLTEVARVVARERIRDRSQRALVVLVTDGRATAGTDALERARHIADRWGGSVETVVVDCESGRFRMGLAAELAGRMGAEHIPLEQVAATGLVEIVTDRTGSRRSAA